MPLQEPKVLEKAYMVTEEVAMRFLEPQVTPALSTPGLPSWMEFASRENVAPLLGPEEDGVGVSASIKHLARRHWG
jgi:predicted thioesterase